MADANAEIGVIQEAYNAGKTQGADMAMSVAGKDVCEFCKDDIAAAAENPDLKKTGLLSFFAEVKGIVFDILGGCYAL